MNFGIISILQILLCRLQIARDARLNCEVRRQLLAVDGGACRDQVRIQIIFFNSIIL